MGWIAVTASLSRGASSPSATDRAGIRTEARPSRPRVHPRGRSRRRGLAATAATLLGSGSGPRVVAATGLLRAGLLAALAAATGVAAATTRARGPGDLGGGERQRGADLVDLELHDRALLALAGLVGALLQTALHDDAHAALQRLGDVLRRLAPHRAGEEQRIAVLPLVGLLVERARRRRDPEVRHGRTRGGEAQLRVVNEVADHRDDGLACHESSLSVGSDQSRPTTSAHRRRWRRQWEVVIHRTGVPRLSERRGA